MQNVITPVCVDKYERLLRISNYYRRKSKFLVDGFRNGFSLGYRGKTDIRRTAPNLKLTVGSELILWNKVMKEVREKRYAGPFKKPPFKFFIQSPIGLVPKDNGRETRLIFHLSYQKDGVSSVNANTPQDICKVKYCDFDMAVKRCIEEGRFCYISKSDMKSAFCNLRIKKKHWPWLLMFAKSPGSSGQIYYFFDKALPFESSISCAHFQAFSDSISHIVKHFTKKVVVNYLDDYLFIAFLKRLGNSQVQVFLDVCNAINFPVAIEKMFWASTSLTFLGLLIDTIRQLICIPIEKVNRATEIVDRTLKEKKVTVQELQRICGYLNFLCRAIVPGRAFTRRLYAYTGSNPENNKNKKCYQLKPHHHVRINREMRADLEVWQTFLREPTIYCRPFIDVKCRNSIDIDMFTDASRNFLLGFGGFCGSSWMCQKWEPFTATVKPSIAYLELYAVTAAVLRWIDRFSNQRISLFCDNSSAVNMINNSSSNCKNCMVLIRIITMAGLKHNIRIFAKHVKTTDNSISDSLSRMQFKRFSTLVAKQKRTMDTVATTVPDEIFPMRKIWIH